MASSQELIEVIKKLPAGNIVLKQIEMKDNIPGGFSICNLNFKELNSLLTNLIIVMKFVSQSQDDESLLSMIVNRLDDMKRNFPLRFDQSMGVVNEVVFFNNIYYITRTDERTFTITRNSENDTPWNTSLLICQVKNHDGTIVNCSIHTIDNSIVIIFEDIPVENHVLIVL